MLRHCTKSGPFRRRITSGSSMTTALLKLGQRNLERGLSLHGQLRALSSTGSQISDTSRQIHLSASNRLTDSLQVNCKRSNQGKPAHSYHTSCSPHAFPTSYRCNQGPKEVPTWARLTPGHSLLSGSSSFSSSSFSSLPLSTSLASPFSSSSLSPSSSRLLLSSTTSSSSFLTSFPSSSSPFSSSLSFSRSFSMSSSSASSSGAGGVQSGTPTQKLIMSYAQGGTSPPLLGKTLGQCMDDMADQKPDQEAFVFLEESIRLTFSQFKEQVDRLAAGFLAIGLGKGDRIGIWGSNTSEWVLTQFAAARIGAILVTINLAYRPTELQYTLHKAGVKVIVSAQTYKTQNYYEMLCTVCPELQTSDPGRLKSNSLPMLDSIIMLGKGDFPGAYMFDDVIDMGTSEDRVKVEELVKKVQFDDPINIMFTSGTTGSPKGATMTHHRLVNNGYHIGYRVGYHKGEHKMCLPIPLYHIFASVGGPIVGITHGVTNIYPTSGYEPVATLKAIQDERCTFIYGTPTMFIDMMSQPSFKDTDVSSIQSGIIGGAPCTPELITQITKGMGMNYIAVGYGMTEAGPMLSVVDEDDTVDKKTNTIGRLCQHMEAKVIDPQTSEILPVGEAGELCVRGYANMTGYWENEEATKATIDATNWLHTGDMATIDEGGYCRIVGRIKELIISGGRNIYPVEIEEYIYTHPKVADVQVVGMPDDRLGEKVVACIRVKAGEDVTQDDIVEFCKGNISHYKIPRHVVFMETFPMTVTGKVQKFKLQEMIGPDLK